MRTPEPESRMGFFTPPPQIISRGGLQFETPSVLANKSAQKESAEIKVEILEEIGSGSFGDVHQAKISILNEDGEWNEYDCVAKHIKVCYASADEFSIQEELTRNQLASAESGVIKPICKKEVDGKLYEFYATGIIDLEKCKGRVAEFIRANEEDFRHFHEHLVIDFFDSMIRTLKTLQKEDMVHADIKPANFVYRLNSDPLVNHNSIKTSGWCSIDFGCTTKSGPSPTLMGTPLYMAPEVKKSLSQPPEIKKSIEYSAAADIYAFGLILKELMNYELPKTENENNTSFSQEKIKENVLSETKFYDCMKKIIDYMTLPDKSNRPTLETLECGYSHLVKMLSVPLKLNDIRQYYDELSVELKKEEQEKRQKPPTPKKRSFFSLLMEQHAKEREMEKALHANTEATSHSHT